MALYQSPKDSLILASISVTLLVNGLDKDMTEMLINLQVAQGKRSLVQEVTKSNHLDRLNI